MKLIILSCPLPSPSPPYFLLPFLPFHLPPFLLSFFSPSPFPSLPHLFSPLPNQKSDKVLSTHLQIHSLHASLWDNEAVFWTKCILNNIKRTRNQLRIINEGISKVNTSKGTLGSSIPERILSLPVSVVTTMDASDCSLQIRMDSVSLQSKGPVARAVMAACVANMQWSPMEDNISSVRSVEIFGGEVVI